MDEGGAGPGGRGRLARACSRRTASGSTCWRPPATPTRRCASWTHFPADSPVMYRQVVRTGSPVFYETLEAVLADYPQLAGRTPRWRTTAPSPACRCWRRGGSLGATGCPSAGATLSPGRAGVDAGAGGPVRAGAGARAALRAELRARTAAQVALARLDTIMETAPVGLGLLGHGPALRARQRAPGADEWGCCAEEPPGAHRARGAAGARRAGRAAAAPGAGDGRAGARRRSVRRHWLSSYYPVHERGAAASSGWARWWWTSPGSKAREEQLRRTAEFRERFMGIVAHDLRNPLNAILLSASALLRAEDACASAREDGAPHRHAARSGWGG